MVKCTKQRLQYKIDFYSNNLITSLISVSLGKTISSSSLNTNELYEYENVVYFTLNLFNQLLANILIDSNGK